MVTKLEIRDKQIQKMFLNLFLVVALIGSVFSTSVLYPTPQGTYDAKSFTTWDKIHVKGSRRGNIYVPVGSDDFVSMTRLDLVGNSYDRGYAHGALLAKELVVFLGPKMDQYLMQQFPLFDISALPEPLQKILTPLQKLGKLAAPKFFKTAMSWVWDQESKSLLFL